MVGVPGKSKGCNTCRARRIKCDEQKPSCQQCQKSNRVCTGYARDRCFKYLSALDHRNLLAKAQPATSLTDSFRLSPEVHHVESYSQHERHPLVESTLQSKLLPLPKELIPNAKLTIPQLFGRFVEGYTPRNKLSTGKAPTLPSWWQVLLDMVGQHESLDLALAALSMIGLGLADHDERLRMEGIKTYGQALDSMQKMLGCAGTLHQEQVLATSLAMSKFELFEASKESIHGWKNHISGLSLLIQLRGPELHSSSVSHQLFLGYRPGEIVHALLKRKKTYLAASPWLTVPWSVSPKDDFHSLLDLLACLTGLLEQSQQILESPVSANDPSETASLLDSGFRIEQELKAWYEDFATKTAGDLYTEIPAENTSPDKIFPTMLRFRTFELFRIHSFYWSAMILLYNSIQTVYSHAFQYRGRPDGSFQRYIFGELGADTRMRSPIAPEEHDNAVDIQDLKQQSVGIGILLAKSINFSISNSMRHLGVHSVLIPLRIALHVFSQRSGPEAMWCRQKFKQFEDMSFPLAAVLCDAEWDDFPVLLS